MIPALVYVIAVETVLIVSLVILCIAVVGCIKQTKLPNGRYLGFNCDKCKGKKDKQGKYLLRCHIKPKIVDLLLWAKVIK
jgi:hypothetical protein